MSNIIDRFKKGTNFYYSDGATYEVFGRVLGKTNAGIKALAIVIYTSERSDVELNVQTYTLSNLESLAKRADLRIIKEFYRRVVRRIFEFG